MTLFNPQLASLHNILQCITYISPIFNEIVDVLCYCFWLERYYHCLSCPSEPSSKSCLGQYSETIYNNYFILSGQITLHETCVLWGYFDHLTYGLETNLHLESFVPAIAWKLQMATTSYFHHIWTIWPFACIIFSTYFDCLILALKLAFTLTILLQPLIGSYKWQLHHIFMTYQT